MLKRVWFTMTVTLALLLGGCGLLESQMPDDGPPVPISEEAAGSLEQKAVEAAAVQGASSVTVTESEVTSYLALRALPADSPLFEPQIHFRADGQVVLRGAIDFQGQRQPVRVAARPSVEAGALELDVTSGQVGAVPLPDSLLAQLDDYLAQAILAGQEYARLDSVQVEEGAITMSGERR